MEKAVRVRISASYPGLLPKNGLTDREYTAKLRYDGFSLAVKSAMAQRGKDALALHRKAKQG